MPEQQENYYVRRLMEEHARLIMDDDPATEEAHLAQIDSTSTSSLAWA